MATLSRYGRLLLADSKRVLSRSFFGSSREGGKGSQSKVLGGASAPVYELQGSQAPLDAVIHFVV